MEFKSIIDFYLDFNQKEKVSLLVLPCYHPSSHSQFKRIHKLRQDQGNLPIAVHRRELLEKLATNQVILVAGDTGCGKSTQVSCSRATVTLSYRRLS